MRISASVIEQMVAHARRDAPNECCGMVGTRDGAASTYYPVRNEWRSPVKFLLHGADLPAVYERAEERGEELNVIYHSHPRSEAYPSQTDINIAREMSGWFPAGVWIICSLAAEEPVMRAFEIADGRVEEVALDVADG